MESHRIDNAGSVEPEIRGMVRCMADVYWLEQSEGDLPPEHDWLSPGEGLVLDSLHFPKRRTDWLLGRWTAKKALAICLGVQQQPAEFARIEIRATLSGAPKAFLADRTIATSISLSHSSGRAMCAVVLCETTLGCDLEKVEPRSDAFVEDYFTSEEQATVRSAPSADRGHVSTLIWSAKESALKALHTGLRADTRSVSVTANDAQLGLPGWHRLQVRWSEDQNLEGWWQAAHGFVRTVVSSVALSQPILLTKNLPDLT